MKVMYCSQKDPKFSETFRSFPLDDVLHTCKININIPSTNQIPQIHQGIMEKIKFIKVFP
jgi:hypothetical protein